MIVKFEMNSTFKRADLLFDDQATPVKIIVANDINGWLETNLKQQKSFRKYQRINREILPQPIGKNQRSTIATLRRKRVELLKSTQKKKIIRNLESTAHTKNNENSQRAGTNEPSSRQRQQFQMHLIEVSDFNAHDDVVFRKRHVVVPYNKAETERTTRAKFTLNSLKMRQLAYSHERKTQFKNINPSLEAVKNQLTAHQRKALNFITKKIIVFKNQL